ncbi:MAG: aspartate--ammonia ligase [Rikenellaceae bacterium]|nr:aspartate--ammonia ligase [Rikenellaceae bacterium]
MALYFPENYRPRLVPETQEQAIKEIKDTFQAALAAELRLRRVTAPLFVLSGTGINDDLSGVERAVSFPVKDMGDARAEVVQSLAKWKRIKLGAYQIAPGYGLYTDMNAIRADEELDNIHSLYVDQWDWERTIRPEERTVAFLKEIVRKIYSVMLEVEQAVYRTHPHITPVLPGQITFIHAQELLDRYPTLSAKERENAIAKECGAVFIIGIGDKLSNGEPHDNRAPDYDDWITPNEEGYTGLNGDMILWNPVLESGYEITSMGIRVTPDSLRQQLALSGKLDQRKGLKYHRMLLDGELPLSIGGGIGQSRLCMFFLRCAHIGEVQASIWPDGMREQCRAHNIELK